MSDTIEARNDRWPDWVEGGAAPRRPRVLISAYACSPDHGSEEGVGWSWARQAARFADTWVIVEQRQYATFIQRYLEQHGPIPGLHFHFVEKPTWLRTLGRLPGLYYPSYQLWQRRAYRVAERLHARWQFDLVHQLTYCGYREPGYLWRLGPPFLWGPLGGTQCLPWRFLPSLSPLGAASEGARNIVNRLQLRFSPRVRQAARRATLIMAASTTNQRDFAAAHRVEPLFLPELQLKRLTGRPRLASDRQPTFRILWSSLFRDFKALPLLLRALAAVPADLDWRLQVLGDGRRRQAWQRLARRLGLADRITWLGWRPHAEALAANQNADVFVFTSLRDTTGNVMVEALGAGVPVICLDHQGAHDIVTPQCGIKVPVTTPREVIAGLATAVTRLARDVDLWTTMSAAAIERARDYLPERRDGQYASVLRRVLGEGFDWSERTRDEPPAEWTAATSAAVPAEQ